MTGDFTALYLNDSEFKKTIELNKRFHPSYDPYLVIRVLNHYNEITFDGLISQNSQFFDRSTCLTKQNSNSSGIINDYHCNRNCAFTFDGIKFFKVVKMATRSDSEGLIIFTFRSINAKVFTEKDTALILEEKFAFKTP